jgi:glucokinase
VNCYIAVDVGGTQTRVALFPEKGIVALRQKKIHTRSSTEKPENRIMDLIYHLWPAQDHVVSIGIDAPGPLDPKNGVVIATPNIPEWNNIPLRQLIVDRFGVPVTLGNDANFAAYGEWKYGAGQGHHNLVYLTISTGIGGGVIMDDQLLLGEHGLATELGHIMILPDGPLCGCGQPGHLEAISSGTAIAAFVADELEKGTPSILPHHPLPTSKEISEAALAGDELARAAFHRAGTYLGMALANFLHIFNPTIIICGGGVSLSGDLILKPARETMEKYVMDQAYIKGLTLTTARLGDDAGLMGALAMARSL